ncbi:MAG: 1-acyl-sn-glycerol-3-phosphate acyltransferase [Caldimonas sp.]|uniref:lysophospholipid acyltransferase family protein n=1 Tax=Caldimonas taiwanensis TaxID=307483 RepID=UPI000784FEA1|nr:lysophospholipid acyltransferase family protein [Caldimonas taiwanensis]GIX23294.1 MAG: 1-acyl-sn-glycerol-3-phosphate acyltransferase [Caldimonas sp.]
MLRSLRALGRLLRVAVHVLHGLLIVHWTFGRLDAAARQQRVQWWSRALLRHLGITLVVRGTPRPGAKLFVANHISWLDIVAINATAPARFVSKAEVRHWPVLHRLVTAAGTLYLEREKRRDALRVVHQVAQALHHGDTVAVFPEGTTGTGHQLLPFHANLLQAAIATGVPVQPIALRYSDRREAISCAVAYVGDTTIVQSLWWVARADGLQVTVHLLEPLGTHHAERRALAQRARQAIEQALAA